MVPLFDIPILSFLCLLAAGILIGHLIWFRDRSEDEANLVDLRNENDELQAALHEHKQAYVELEADMEDRRKGWEQLKTANQQLEQAQQTNHQDLTEVNGELARLQHLKDQAFHDLDQERQQRRALQEELTQAEENSFRASTLAEQLQTEVANFEVRRHEFDDRTSLLAERADLEQDLRSQVEAANQQCDSLTRERDALLHRLEAGKDDASSISQLQSQQDTLRQQIAESNSSLEKTESQLRQREEDLASLREERDVALEQVENERTGRSNLESQVQKVEQLVTQRDDALTRVADVEKELAESKIRVDQLSEGLEQRSLDTHVLQNSHEEAKLELKQETDILRKKLAALLLEHEAVSQVLIDERSRLSTMEAENHRFSMMASEAETKAQFTHEELKSNLARKQVETDTLRSELEDVASQLSRERHQREHLQTVLHEQKVEFAKFQTERQQFQEQVGSLTTENESLAGQATEFSALRDEYSNAEQRIASLSDELTELRTQQQETLEEKNALAGRVEELNGQVSQYTKQLAQIRVEGEEQISELDRLQQIHRTTLASRMELESAKETLEQQVRQLQTELDDAREYEASSVELKSRLSRVTAQRDEAAEKHSEQERVVSSLQEKLSNSENAAADVQRQLSGLESRTDEHDELRRTYLQLQTQANESADRLRRVTVERDSQRDALRNAESRLGQLESRAKANEDTIRNLRRERAAVLVNTRQPSTFSFSSLSARSVPEEDSGGRMRRDDVLGVVYTQPPKRKDDLKRISGIAQVLEKKLNAFGVYTYRQVMEWDQVAIAEFSKLLSFRDRIERDDWVGQARNLQFETYGRAA